VIWQALAAAHRIAAPIRSWLFQHGQCGIGQILHMHRLAQAIGSGRQHEKAGFCGHSRHLRHRLVAAAAIDQGRPQHRDRRRSRRGHRKQSLFGLLQALGDSALMRVIGIAFHLHAGGAECHDPRRLHRRARVPVDEMMSAIEEKSPCCHCTPGCAWRGCRDHASTCQPRANNRCSTRSPICPLPPNSSARGAMATVSAKIGADIGSSIAGKFGCMLNALPLLSRLHEPCRWLC
jgi:hypothetical protein